MAENYPDVEVDYLFIDNAAMQLILNPAQFDVIVTSNMFGDILSDEASVLAGSLGLLPSSSIGTFGKLYEPVHGSFPQAKGKDIANPIATILSAAIMLKDMNLEEEASDIEQAVNYCISNNILTKELNPDNPYTGSEVSSFIISNIGEQIISKEFA
jgi:3-isopropylmalate dehydrogenase